MVMSMISLVKVLKEECLQMLKKERAKRREGLKLRFYLQSKDLHRRRFIN